MDYRQIIESRYNRKNWQELLFDIFRNKAQFWQQPQRVPVDESMAKSAYYTGKITLPDGHTIAIYEVELSDNVIIERNRAGIRNLLCTNWRGMGCSGAFMFCFRQHEAVLRFSYVSEAFTFAEDGSLKKDSTDTKRFTYLLGEGHRSRTAIQQFEKLKASGLTLKDITKAFSVEALSDLFFKEYKKQYEDIIEFVTGKRIVKVANKWEERVTGEPCREIMQEFAQFPDAEKAVRDYVKKLMGRLVFIQFLQKKGWMGCSAGEAWNDGDREFVQNLFANTTHKNTFIDEVLEPLFNDINTKRKDDLASDWSNFYLLPYKGRSGGGLKVPYLNGGLFEHDDYDKTTFPLPAKYMKSLLDFFASYNFTIDENDPDDAEIGVDPEMLGRIFENLLEDNKDKGAFYTPKEIVQYMCRESLIAYLQTDEEDEAVKLQIREFVTTNNAALLSTNLAASIDQKLKDVKICDPAIGSGAFPMGLMKELYACRIALSPLGESEGASVQIKTHIIQNNIYGVDIEKGAVDIARLRFWLALIVDEKTPHALPNMDFKIMQGNSLLEQYEGIDLSKIVSGQKVVRQKAKIRGKQYDMSSQTEFVYEGADAMGNIQTYLRDYFSITDHQKKEEYKNCINKAVHDFIRVNIPANNTELVTKLENLPIPNDQFFLWHLYFKEVFDKGGFDIVIGNPPYIRQEKLGANYKKTLTSIYPEVGNGTADILVYFFAIGLKILRRKGVLAYITSNKFLKTKYGRELRNTLSNKTDVRLFIDFFELPVFQSAATDAGITILTNGYTGKSTKYFPIKTLNQLDLVKITSGEFKITIKNESEWQFINSNEYNILNKINNDTISLKEFTNDSIFYGIKTGFNKAFVIKDLGVASKLLASESAAIVRHYIAGPDIKKWNVDDKGYYFLATGYDVNVEKLYPTAYHYLSQFKEELTTRGDKGVNFYNLRACAYYDVFDRPKIVYIRTAKEHNFYLDEEKYYVNDSCYIIASSSRFLVAFLNSKLFNFYKKLRFVAYGDGQDGGRCKLEYNKMLTVPIKKGVNETPYQIIVDKLLAIKKANPLADTTAEEREIDRLVYDLYGLTEDEIAIVERTN